LKKLKDKIYTNPTYYDNQWRNLKSFAQQLHNEEVKRGELQELQKD